MTWQKVVACFPTPAGYQKKLRKFFCNQWAKK